jgi:hypothetical protein
MWPRHLHHTARQRRLLLRCRPQRVSQARSMARQQRRRGRGDECMRSVSACAASGLARSPMLVVVADCKERGVARHRAEKISWLVARTPVHACVWPVLAQSQWRMRRGKAACKRHEMLATWYTNMATATSDQMSRPNPTTVIYWPCRRFDSSQQLWLALLAKNSVSCPPEAAKRPLVQCRSNKNLGPNELNIVDCLSICARSAKAMSQWRFITVERS